MAWARDKNGREFWLDESGYGGRGARGRMETNSPQDVSMTLPAPTSYDQGIEAGKIAQRTRQYDLRSFASREAADLAGAGSDAHVLPPLDSVPARPAWVLESPAAPAGGGSLHGGPTDVAGRGMLPAPGPRMPVSLPPVTVEATRLPPVVEGVTMRRGAPGSGDFGERADLTPTVFRRDTPMGVPEATARGLVYAVPLNREGPQDMTAANRINATPGMRAFDMEMRSEDAAAMRQGFRAESGARGAAAAMRATGRVGASRDIVAKILGEEQAEGASGRRMREARMTPQVRDGVAYDPLTGKSAEVQRGGGAVRPTKWEEYTPKELGDMVNDAVRSMMPEGDSAAFKTALLTAKTDEEKQEVYRKFQARPTPAQQLIMDTALAELEKRGGAKPQGGGAGGGGAVYKPGMFGKR